MSLVLYELVIEWALQQLYEYNRSTLAKIDILYAALKFLNSMLSYMPKICLVLNEVVFFFNHFTEEYSNK